MNEKTLVRRVLHGDRDAFEPLVERYWPVLRAVAMARLGSAEEAEDIVQETFLQAYESLSKLRDPERIGAWLTRIAINRCKSRITRHVRERRWKEGQESLLRTPTRGTASDEMSELLHEHIMKLEERKREVLLLHYFAGESLLDLARHLDISRAAAAKRLQRARDELGARMLEELPKEPAQYSPSRRNVSATMALVMNSKGTREATVASGTAISISSALKTAAFLACAVGFAALGFVLLRQEGVDTSIPIEPPPLVHLAEEPPAPGPMVADPQSDAIETETSEIQVADEPVERVIPEQDPIESPPAGSVSGRVIDAYGQPISSAKVTAFIGTWFEEDEGLDSGRYFEASTNRSGEYRIASIPYSGEFYLSAVAYSYAHGQEGKWPTSFHLEQGESVRSADIVLNAGIMFTGRVLSPAGSPVRGAAVWATKTKTSYGGSSFRGYSTLTDSAGQFQMGFVDVISANLEVMSATSGRAVFPAVEIQDNYVAELRMTLNASLSGRAVWENGEFAGEIRFILDGEFIDPQPNANQRARFRTFASDADGRFEIPHLDPTLEYTVDVLSVKNTEALLADPAESFTLAPGEHVETLIRLKKRLPVAGLLRGTVVGAETGSPVAGVRVVAEKRVGERRLLSRGKETGPDGRFEIQPKDGIGEYLLYGTYAHDSYVERGENFHAESGISVVVSDSPVAAIELKVPEAISARIQVLDRVGDPIEGAEVRAMIDSTGEYLGTTNGEGFWIEAGISPRSERIEFTTKMEGYASSTGKTRSLGEAEDLLLEETLVIYEASGLEGTAIDEAGNPIANRSLEITYYSKLLGTKWSRVRTDFYGRFTLTEDIPSINQSVKLEFKEQDGDASVAALKAVHVKDVECFPELITNLGVLVFSPAIKYQVIRR